MVSSSQYSKFIKTEALKLGFQFCGISKAGFLEEEAPRLESWLKSGYHGEMSYMENHFDKRLDPRKLVDGARSVISLSLNYFTDQQQDDASAPKISKYAYGKDYHFVIKDKLKLLMEAIRANIGEVNGRAFVDSAPVLDKVWAKKAGIGWLGKHSNFINKNTGSFFFLAELITDLELEYDVIPTKDHCGTCTRCIDACPTEAIVAPYLVDGSRCISYLTIELKMNCLLNSGEKWKTGCSDVIFVRMFAPGISFQYSIQSRISVRMKTFSDLNRQSGMNLPKKLLTKCLKTLQLKEQSLAD
jgi:epoxyqueuosine reductase